MLVSTVDKSLSSEMADDSETSELMEDPDVVPDDQYSSTSMPLSSVYIDLLLTYVAPSLF